MGSRYCVSALMENVEGIYSFVETELLRCGVSSYSKIMIALDEVVANIVNYSQAKEIAVMVEYIDGEVRVQVEDDGILFNPLEVNTMAVEKPVKEREVGGLGIFITKKVMDSVIYSVKDGKNLLELRFATK